MPNGLHKPATMYIKNCKNACKKKSIKLNAWKDAGARLVLLTHTEQSVQVNGLPYAWRERKVQKTCNTQVETPVCATCRVNAAWRRKSLKSPPSSHYSSISTFSVLNPTSGLEKKGQKYFMQIVSEMLRSQLHKLAVYVKIIDSFDSKR